MRGGRLTLGLLLATLVCTPPPAAATAPGQNGKIAFESGGDIFVMNAGGTGVVNLTNTPFGENREGTPGWSPDGTQIAFSNNPDLDPRLTRIEKMNADGAGRTIVGGWDETSWLPDWSPGGDEIVFETCVSNDEFFLPCRVVARTPDGTGGRRVIGSQSGTPSWSPDGKRIAFVYDPSCSELDPCMSQLHVANADGTNITPVNTAAAPEGTPDWSPDGTRIVFVSGADGDSDIYSAAPDGSNLVQLTDDPASDSRPSWSPDGTKIVFNSNREVSGGIYSMNADGSGVTRVGSATGLWPVWQPLPVNAYPRPKGASPQRLSLVPAYQECTAPNRTHSEPLAFDSCSPPAKVSQQLTVGTPDANGQPAKSVSHVRINPVRGLPSTPADEADVRLRGMIDDVRLASDLSDYTGDLELRLTVQITDRDNTPHPGGPGPATGQKLTHSHPLPCAATADTTVGATCAFDTTVEALVPGAVKELQRAIWALDQVTVHDGAGDPFLRQGVFIP